MEQPADHRDDAIGANQQRASVFGRVRTANRHALAGRGECHDLPSQPQGVSAHRREQRAMQCRTERHDRGAAERRVQPADQIAVHPADLHPAVDGARALHLIADAQLLERGERIGRKQQPEPQFPGLRGAFVHADVPAGPSKRDAGGKTADACANDEGGGPSGCRCT